MHILILDTDDAFRESLSRILRTAGHSVTIAHDLVEATNNCSPDNCDLVFLDVSSQPALLPSMKEKNPDIPVVILSQNPSIESIIAAMRLGTFDYLIKPLTDTEPLMEALDRARRTIEAASNQRAFLKRILKTFSELSIANEKMRERGYVDETTEYYYSHYFEDILAIELARSQRFNYNFTIMSVRLNYLQKYMSPETNAEFSSQIETISDFLHQRVRRTDVLVRTGVSEFMIILVETPKEGGMILAENLRQGIVTIIPAEVVTTCQAEGNPPITIGTATYPLDGIECQDLMNKACQCQ